MEFASILEKELKDRNMTQCDLAIQIDVSIPCISNLIRSKHDPSIHTLMSIADVFDVSTDYLLGREEIK